MDIRRIPAYHVDYTTACATLTAVLFTSASHKWQNNRAVKCFRSQGRTKVHLAPFKSSKVPPEAPNTCSTVRDTAGVFSVTADAAHGEKHALDFTVQNNRKTTVLQVLHGSSLWKYPVHDADMNEIMQLVAMLR